MNETRRGAHRARRSSPTAMTIVLTAAGVVALAAAGYGVVQALDADGSADPAASGTPGFTCPASPITVTAAPAIAPVIQAQLDSVAQANSCADAFTVTAMDSAKAVDEINARKAPDVWVPDARSWATQVDPQRARATWLDGTGVATSPVVLASASADATAAPASWKTALASGDTRLARLEEDAASRAAYLAARDGSTTIDEATGAKFIALAQTLAPGTAKLAQTTDKSFPTTEQAVLASNGDLSMSVPKQGTLALDYRWATNPTLTGARLEATDVALKALRTPEGRTALLDAGFRVGDAKPEGAVNAKVGKLPDAKTQTVAMQQWGGLATPLRLLAVFDVSGSMKAPVRAGGPSRAEVASRAANQALGSMPPTSQVGVWVFSSRSGPIRAEYREVVPVRPLGAKVGSGTQRQVLSTAISGVGKYVGGDTALYDTTWAAFDKMNSSYDDGSVNAVAIITDGVDDNPGRGDLNLTQLVEKLRAEYSHDKPVPIVTIGLGEADPAALQAISLATETQSYLVKDPSDIGRVLVDGLSSWRD